MNWLIAGCWLVSVAVVAYFLKGSNQGCSGDCNQGRKQCNCGKYYD